MQPKLDNIDILLINSLIKNGRKSFREISKEIKFSVPTVEAHFTKLMKFGVIKNIVPIFDLSKIQNYISVFVFIKISNPSRSYDIAKEISLLSEIKSIHMLTGEFNLLIKLVGEFPEQIEEFIRTKISGIKGISSVNSQIITRIIKEDQSYLIKENLKITIQCDYCNNEILNNLKILKFGNYERNFCCNSCLKLYKEKYGARIESLSSPINDNN